jgi:DNA-binding MarR family transcriptional regulator
VHGAEQMGCQHVKKRTKDLERWARLADLVLIIAREIQFRGYSDVRAVPLTASEGMVMRYLQTHPVAQPNQIASATGLQRSNLSTLLRGLESKGLLKRLISTDDRRGVTVRLTERGAANYALVRREWAAAVAKAGSNGVGNLDAALGLLAEIEAGLIEMRPTQPGRDMGRAEE